MSIITSHHWKFATVSGMHVVLEIFCYEAFGLLLARHRVDGHVRLAPRFKVWHRVKQDLFAVFGKRYARCRHPFADLDDGRDELPQEGRSRQLQQGRPAVGK